MNDHWYWELMLGMGMPLDTPVDKTTEDFQPDSAQPMHPELEEMLNDANSEALGG